MGAAAVPFSVSPTFSDLLSNLVSLPPNSWLLVAYVGLGPAALASYLEARGQLTVPATQAQVGACVYVYACMCVHVCVCVCACLYVC